MTFFVVFYVCLAFKITDLFWSLWANWSVTPCKTSTSPSNALSVFVICVTNLFWKRGTNYLLLVQLYLNWFRHLNSRQLFPIPISWYLPTWFSKMLEAVLLKILMVSYIFGNIILFIVSQNLWFTIILFNNWSIFKTRPNIG